MARVSKVDACLICGETPCRCGKQRLATPTAVSSDKSLTLDPSVRLEIPRLRPKYVPHTGAKLAHSTQVSTQQLVRIAALRNLESIMSDEAREEFQVELMTEPTHEERVAFWRARRDEGS